MSLSIPNGSCYNINGLISPYDSHTYVPCNHTALALGKHSACCAPGDRCSSNGMCQSSTSTINDWWRIGCTDPTYSDPSCPTYCGGIQRNDPVSLNHLTFECPGDGKYCCSTGHFPDFKDKTSTNTTCCDIKDLTFDAKDNAVYTTAEKWTLGAMTPSVSPTTYTNPSDSAITATTTATYAASESASATAPPTTQAQASSSSSSSNTTTIGIGLGVGLPVGLAFIAGLIIFLRRRHKKQAQARLRSPSTPQELASDSYFAPAKFTTTTTMTSQTSSQQAARAFEEHRNARGFTFPARSTTAETNASANAPSMAPSAIKYAFFNPFKRRKASPSDEEHTRQQEREDEASRRENPHAYRREAGGSEVAAELDGTSREPVELWSPVEKSGRGPEMQETEIGSRGSMDEAEKRRGDLGIGERSVDERRDDPPSWDGLWPSANKDGKGGPGRGQLR